MFEVVQNEGNGCCRGFNHCAEQGRRCNQFTPTEALTVNTLVTPTEQGIASRVLARTAGGNLTMVVPLEAIHARDIVPT